MDTSVLEKVGLSSKEISVYLALLKLGPSSVTAIADRSQVDRTLCYSILSKLIDKGYVSFISDSQSKKFSAADPQKFLVDTQIQQEQLTKLLPQLRQLTQKNESVLSTEIFKGKEGPAWVFSDFMTKNCHAYFYGDLQYEYIVPLQLEKYFRYLKEKKLNEYLIIPEGELPVLTPVHSKVRTVPKHMLSPSSTWIYADTTATTIWSDPILTLVIKNKDVAHHYQQYFNYLWKFAKKTHMPKSVYQSYPFKSAKGR